MGTVYEAHDLRLNRSVALKFIRGGDPRLAMRLLREARAQASIRHENICKVYEVGEVEGRPYIAMQLVEGGRSRRPHPACRCSRRWWPCATSRARCTRGTRSASFTAT